MKTAAGGGPAAPSVNAGDDGALNIFYGDVYTLEGSGTADTYQWTKVSGSGTPTWADDTDPTSTVDFDAADTYVLELEGTGPGGTTTDQVTIVVTSAAALDTATAANALYCPAWKLRSAYAGNALRVRRASDNAETNIGWDAADNSIDTAALASHCGASNGFLVTLNDQSGNGRNLTQATTSHQHKIYDSATGAVALGTALAAMLANDATDRQSRGDGCGLSGASGGTLAYVAKASAGAATRVLGVLGAAGAGGDSIQAFSLGLTQMTVGIEVGSRTFTSPDLSASIRDVICSIGPGAQAGTATCYVDGSALSELSSSNPTTASNINGTATHLGHSAGTATWRDYIGAFGVWAGAISGADRALWTAMRTARFGS